MSVAYGAHAVLFCHANVVHLLNSKASAVIITSISRPQPQPLRPTTVYPFPSRPPTQAQCVTAKPTNNINLSGCTTPYKCNAKYNAKRLVTLPAAY